MLQITHLTDFKVIGFYDRSIRSWTVVHETFEGDQIGEAQYFANKQSLAECYKIIGKENGELILKDIL